MRAQELKSRKSSTQVPEKGREMLEAVVSLAVFLWRLCLHAPRYGLVRLRSRAEQQSIGGALVGLAGAGVFIFPSASAPAPSDPTPDSPATS